MRRRRALLLALVVVGSGCLAAVLLAPPLHAAELYVVVDETAPSGGILPLTVRTDQTKVVVHAWRFEMPEVLREAGIPLDRGETLAWLDPQERTGHRNGAPPARRHPAAAGAGRPSLSRPRGREAPRPRPLARRRRSPPDRRRGGWAGRLCDRLSSRTSDSSRSARPDGLLVWAVNRTTGVPIEGVSLKVDLGGRALLWASTKKDGTARLEAGLPPTARLWAAWGQHLALGESTWYDDASASTARRVYLHTHQPAYRPGETVEVRGIVRAVESGRLHLDPSVTLAQVRLLAQGDQEMGQAEAAGLLGHGDVRVLLRPAEGRAHGRLARGRRRRRPVLRGTTHHRRLPEAGVRGIGDRRGAARADRRAQQLRGEGGVVRRRRARRRPRPVAAPLPARGPGALSRGRARAALLRDGARGLPSRDARHRHRHTRREGNALRAPDRAVGPGGRLSIPSRNRRGPRPHGRLRHGQDRRLSPPRRGGPDDGPPPLRPRGRRARDHPRGGRRRSSCRRSDRPAQCRALARGAGGRTRARDASAQHPLRDEGGRHGGRHRTAGRRRSVRPARHDPPRRGRTRRPGTRPRLAARVGRGGTSDAGASGCGHPRDRGSRRVRRRGRGEAARAPGGRHPPDPRDARARRHPHLRRAAPGRGSARVDDPADGGPRPQRVRHLHDGRPRQAPDHDPRDPDPAAYAASHDDRDAGSARRRAGRYLGPYRVADGRERIRRRRRRGRGLRRGRGALRAARRSRPRPSRRSSTPRGETPSGRTPSSRGRAWAGRCATRAKTRRTSRTPRRPPSPRPPPRRVPPPRDRRAEAAVAMRDRGTRAPPVASRWRTQRSPRPVPRWPWTRRPATTPAASRA